MGHKSISAVVLAAALVALLAASGALPASSLEEQGTSLRAQAPRGVKQSKLDSALAAVAEADKSGGSTAALSVARANRLKIKGGRIQVVVTAVSAAADASIKGHGGSIEARHGNRTQALLPPGALKKLADEDTVRYVRPPLRPVPEAVAGEGVAATNASAWQALGRTGAGVKVAIVDLGFAGYTQRQAEGDLPASLTTVDFCGGDFSSGEVHGTAVAEIVHEMAPDAALTLICIDSEVTLAQAEEYAEANGIKIVNHSVGWFNDSRGDGSGGAGTVAGVIAAARAAGILWVNAAGNDAQRHWSGTFNDTNGDGFHDYTSLDEGNTFFVPAGSGVCVTLKWDSWPATSQDYDLYVARSSDGALVGYSENLQNGTQAPTEETCFANPSGFGDFFFVAIYRFAATAKPRLDVFILGGGSVQYQVAAGSINEAAASPSAFAAGAICWQSSALEPFSSRGPTIDNRVKPDIAGQDGVSSATYGNFGSCGGGTGFFGTSAAAPHTAGVAALVLGQNPSFNVTQLQNAVTGAAQDLGSAGKDNLFGAGKLRVPGIVAPKITSFSPTAAPVGATVTVIGSAFTGASSLTFNAVPAGTLTVNSATKITTVVPAGASTGALAVTTPDGTGTSATLFKVTPKLLSLSTNAATRGTSIQIIGTTFTGASAVKFGSVAASTFSIDDDSHITTTVPATAMTGNVTVMTTAGTSNGLPFTVILPPTISGFSPAAGPVGSLLTISGSNLSSVTSASIGGSAATITPVSASQLKLTVPAGAQSGQITLTNAAGPVTSVPLFKVTPKITGFSPPSGLRGTSILITGTTFTGATSVKLGSLAALFSVDDDSHITATVPAGATTNKLSVTTPAGASTSAASYTVILPPTVSGFSPASGVAGTVVTISGSNLAGATGVTFNGIAASNVTPLSAAQVKATVPPGATTGKIAVTTAAGTAQSAGTFTIPLSVTSFSPSSGAVGTVVTLQGSGLTAVTGVKFGAVATSFEIHSASELTATVPFGAKSGPIVVANGSVSAATSSSFGVSSVSSVSPGIGVPGTSVLIKGAFLAAATSVDFNGAAATFHVDSSTQITATVPTAASDGPVSVHVGLGVATSPDTFAVIKMTGFGPQFGNVGASVTITGAHLDSATAVKFGGATAVPTSISPKGTTLTAVVPALAKTGAITVVTPNGNVEGATDFAVVPTVTSMTPDGGAAGTSVTIMGTGFAGVTDVRFGATTSLDGVSAPFTTNAGATRIDTTVPVGALPGRILLVVPSTATAPALGAWTDTFHALLLGDPSPSLALPGDQVTLGGWSLEGITNVSFGGGATATPDPNSNDRFLYVTVPAGAQTGKITVHTKYGDVSTPTTLFVEGIVSFSPSGGGGGTLVTINGKGFQEPGNSIQNVAVGGAWVASFTVNSDTKITATLPAYGFSTGEVTIFTSAGFYTLWQPFFVVPTAITSFAPASGSPGTFVTIHGTNLRYNVDGVRFNGVDAAWGLDSATQDAYAWVPNGATTGPIAVHTVDGWVTSNQAFTVS